MLRLIRPRVVMQTILLVDDNPLRASMRRVLLEGGSSNLGRAVVRALDASEALCMVETPEFADELVLVVCAHGMSGVTGPEFVAELRSRMPGLPILVLGASVEMIQRYEGIADVFHSSTQSPDELRGLVARLLHGGAKKSA